MPSKADKKPAKRPPAAKKAPAKKTAKRPKPRPRKPKVDTGPPELWERQQGESAEAFQAFARYRDLGVDRSAAGGIRRVARELDKSASLLGRWSATHSWTLRAAAWDAEIDRQHQAELRQKQLDAAQRHAQIVQGQMVALSAGAQELMRRIAEDPKFVQGMTKQELLQFVVQGARAVPRLVVSERLSLGISTENLANADGSNLTDPDGKAAKMSDGELDAFLLGAQAGAAAAADADEDID